MITENARLLIIIENCTLITENCTLITEICTLITENCTVTTENCPVIAGNFTAIWDLMCIISIGNSMVSNGFI